MRGVPTTFCGKFHQNGDVSAGSEWHPLFDHCADVAAVVEALLGLRVWHERLARLAGRELDAVDRARLCVFAALHDLGKLNLGFQAKGRPDLGSTAGHVEEALAALDRREVLTSVVDSISAWGDGADLALLSAICRHGRPHAIRSTAAKWQPIRWVSTKRHGLTVAPEPEAVGAR